MSKVEYILLSLIICAVGGMVNSTLLLKGEKSGVSITLKSEREPEVYSHDVGKLV